MLCYSLSKHARFCEPGVVTVFPTTDDIFNFFVEDLVEDEMGIKVRFNF